MASDISEKEALMLKIRGLLGIQDDSMIIVRLRQLQRSASQRGKFGSPGVPSGISPKSSKGFKFTY